MSATLQTPGFDPVAGRDVPAAAHLDERAARRALRAQVARLEREAAGIVASAFPRLDPGASPPSLAGPRLLGLAELERMLADPPAHRWRRLSNADLGRPGCTTYHVRPLAAAAAHQAVSG
jgi:hypothetical protein